MSAQGQLLQFLDVLQGVDVRGAESAQGYLLWPGVFSLWARYDSRVLFFRLFVVEVYILIF